MLTSPALAPRATEKGLQKLLDEFWTLYFTGSPHASLLGPVTFPVVDLFYNQATIEPPGAGRAQIHTVFTDFRPRESWWDKSVKLVQTKASLLTIFVRTINAGETDNSAEFLCRDVADNVKEILQDGDARLLLESKGLRNCHLKSGPTPLPLSGFQLRVLLLSSDLRYFIPRQPED